MHTAVGCGGSIYWTQLGSTGYLGAGYVGGLAVPSSNVCEKDVIFGGDERLAEQVEHTLRIVDGELYVIITGCMTDIIGDDIGSIAREFADRAPIVAVETGGFRGNGYVGYDLVLRGLFRDFVRRGEKRTPDLVNLWGVVPGQDVFWRGNLERVRDLLESLGLRVNSFFSGRDSVAALETSSAAALNIVVSQAYGHGAAELFEEEHGVPYLSTQFPIGPTATTEFLRDVGAALELPPATVERAVGAGIERYFRYVERVADSYNDLDLQRYAVVVGDANYAPALTRFLADDLGWLPELTVVTDPIDDEVTRARVTAPLLALESGLEPHVEWETTTTDVGRILMELRGAKSSNRYFDSFSPAFVIGSSHERELAKNIGAGHLTVAYPVADRVVLDRGYAGYDGSLSLIEDLLSVLVRER
jgi:nitrogenase molybdenum-iron protein beta chain